MILCFYQYALFLPREVSKHDIFDEMVFNCMTEVASPLNLEQIWYKSFDTFMIS